MQSHIKKISAAGLLITLGIIFGDIGTSPLYVFKSIIGDRPITEDLVYGGISCVFWTLTLQTTFKYIVLTLEADPRGHPGTLRRPRHEDLGRDFRCLLRQPPAWQPDRCMGFEAEPGIAGPADV